VVLISISIVIPVFNEQDNVTPLYSQIRLAIGALTTDYEIIFVDDGSSDCTFQKLLALHKKDQNLKIIKFKKNFGQTAALDAGFKLAKGETIITMDGDLQNDPADMARLISKLNEGYDAVSGIRTNRKDSLFKKTSASIAYFIRQAILQDDIRDSGCSLKAYRKSCLSSLYLRGELHRFIPALLKAQGFKIAEVPVSHRKRAHDRTKYGFMRLLNGFIDVLALKFWQRFSARPMHFFGLLGICSFMSGALIATYLVAQKLLRNITLADRPLLLLATLLIIVGLQFFFFGILADILMRIYYKTEEPYTIEKIVQ
jgi:glycosyltransferase involved in cell wall biosynthesis